MTLKELRFPLGNRPHAKFRVKEAVFPSPFLSGLDIMLGPIIDRRGHGHDQNLGLAYRRRRWARSRASDKGNVSSAGGPSQKHQVIEIGARLLLISASRLRHPGQPPPRQVWRGSP